MATKYVAPNFEDHRYKTKTHEKEYAKDSVDGRLEDGTYDDEEYDRHGASDPHSSRDSRETHHRATFGDEDDIGVQRRQYNAGAGAYPSAAQSKKFIKSSAPAEFSVFGYPLWQVVLFVVAILLVIIFIAWLVNRYKTNNGENMTVTPVNIPPNLQKPRMPMPSPQQTGMQPPQQKTPPSQMQGPPQMDDVRMVRQPQPQPLHRPSNDNIHLEKPKQRVQAASKLTISQIQEADEKEEDPVVSEKVVEIDENKAQAALDAHNAKMRKSTRPANTVNVPNTSTTDNVKKIVQSGNSTETHPDDEQL